MGTTPSRQDEDEFTDLKFAKDPFRLIGCGRAGQVVVVDVSGESDEVLLVGKELTIDSDSSTGAFFDFRPLKGRWPLGKLASWKCLGRLPLPPDLSPTSDSRSYPEFWGTRLDTTAAELFQQMGLTQSEYASHQTSHQFAWRLASSLLGCQDFGSLSKQSST